ncbi:hypothetical protein HY212_02265 [Candidatus Pacearchaeota archaeon]|nr:hypothetical protein [Candidatus Pacearchaeota archaeon]
MKNLRNIFLSLGIASLIGCSSQSVNLPPSSNLNFRAYLDVDNDGSEDEIYFTPDKQTIIKLI